MVKKKSVKKSLRKGKVSLRNIVFLSLSVLVLASALFIANYSSNSNTEANASGQKKVIGYYVYWDQARGFQSIQNNADVLTEVSPWAYTLNSNAGVILDPAGGADVVDQTSLNFMRSHNIKVIPAIHNLIGGNWNGGNIVSNILANPSLTQTHITNIVNMVVSNNYDGVDIDYENLNSTDRTAYTQFLTNLASQLHAQGKIITTDVYGKTSEPGGWSGPQAQDYQAIGAVVDEVRFMLYDYNPAVKGPIAPYVWTNDVLAFALTKMPTNKIIQGVPLYGYDWTGSNGNPVDYTWTEATAKAAQFGATVNWDSANKVSWFTYSSGGTHTVYFENALSSGYKFDLTNNRDIGGVQFWRLGGEDPQTWTTLRAKFTVPTPTVTSAITPIATDSGVPTFTPAPTTIPSPTMPVLPTATPAGDTIAPSVSITVPKTGTYVGNKTTTLTATASDNVRVTKVEFYADNALLVVDTAIPYSYVWNTKSIAKGAHFVTVIAYDAAGNTASAQITVNK